MSWNDSIKAGKEKKLSPCFFPLGLLKPLFLVPYSCLPMYLTVSTSLPFGPFLDPLTSLSFFNIMISSYRFNFMAPTTTSDHLTILYLLNISKKVYKGWILYFNFFFITCPSWRVSIREYKTISFFKLSSSMLSRLFLPFFCPCCI